MASGDKMGLDDRKVTIRIPKRFLDAIDFLVEMDDFPTRSEAIRTAVRNLVYERVDFVTEKSRKIQEAEKSIAQLEEVRKQYLKK
jgi:antitoxin ParD1/3/4